MAAIRICVTQYTEELPAHLPNIPQVTMETIPATSRFLEGSCVN